MADPNGALSVPQREKGVAMSLAQEGMPTPLYALHVPTQTKAIGVIVPPPEIRAIVVSSSRLPPISRRLFESE